MATELEFVNYKDFVESLSSVDSAENTDKSVVSNPTDGPRNFDASRLNKLEFFVVTDNLEYLYAITDKDGVFLFGIKKDGSVDWQKGIPGHIKFYLDAFSQAIDSLTDGKVDKSEGKSLISETFANCISFISTAEYAMAVTDATGKVLLGVRADGSFFWTKGGVEIDGKGLIDSVYAEYCGHKDNKEYLSVLEDASGRIVKAIDESGCENFFVPPKFEKGLELSKEGIDRLEKDLRDNGFSGGAGDWTESSSVQIPLPKCAVVNFSGIDAMPTTKTQDLEAEMQFCDMSGNYFKKKVVMNAQGNSSLGYPKKNLSIDILNSDNSSFKVQFGDWVEQDSFHIKAYYTEVTRAIGCVMYDYYDEMVKSRGLDKDAPWKVAQIKNTDDYSEFMKGIDILGSDDVDMRADFGARCHPLGFPCIVLLNGAFYGVFAWQLKKSKESMHQEKSNANHIHLDGTLDAETIFGGTIDWTAFEIRNPKTLAYMDGSKYDGDNPDEIYEGSSTDPKCVLSNAVKPKIERLAGAMADIESVVDEYGIDSQEFKSAFDSYFDVDNMIDFIIFTDVTQAYDLFRKNWQWATWDGLKWFVNIYDLDCLFGLNSAGNAMNTPSGNHTNTSADIPTGYIFRNAEYSARLKARWDELVSLGVIDANKIVGYISQFVNSVGKSAYKSEFQKWPDSPTWKGSVINDAYWELVLVDGEPVYGDAITYDNDAYYVAGNEVFFAANTSFGIKKFRCVSPCHAVTPYSSISFKDSLWRLFVWTVRKINNLKQTAYAG